MTSEELKVFSAAIQTFGMQKQILMGFHKGRVLVEEQVIDWLERMVRDG